MWGGFLESYLLFEFADRKYGGIHRPHFIAAGCSVCRRIGHSLQKENPLANLCFFILASMAGTYIYVCISKLLSRIMKKSVILMLVLFTLQIFFLLCCYKIFIEKERVPALTAGTLRRFSYSEFYKSTLFISEDLHQRSPRSRRSIQNPSSRPHSTSRYGRDPHTF